MRACKIEGGLRVFPFARLIASLLYGSGLRLSECLRLRVKEIDLEGRQIVLCDTKVGRQRVTVFPGEATAPFVRHLNLARNGHRANVQAG